MGKFSLVEVKMSCKVKIIVLDYCYCFFLVFILSFLLLSVTQRFDLTITFLLSLSTDV